MEQQILEIAQQSFITQGPRMVTMDDIAAQAGVSKKTLYQHFCSKEALIEKVHQNLFEQIKLLLKEVSGLSSNAIEELIMLQNQIFELVKSDNEVFMHQLMVYYPKIHQKVKKEVYPVFRDYLQKNIDRGIEEGLYEMRVDANVVISFMMAVNFSIKEGSLYEGLGYSLKELDRLYLKFHLYSIASNKGRLELKKIFNRK